MKPALLFTFLTFFRDFDIELFCNGNPEFLNFVVIVLVVVFDIDIFLSWMEEVRNLGLHEKTYILAGITPLKSVRMAKYLSRSVPGMKVPDGLIGRLDRVPPEEAGDEGVKIAVETIDRLRAVPGVAGIHIMAVQWEEKVGEIVVRAGLEKENHGGR